MLEKPATTEIPIADLLARRWSSRAIDPAKPITREHLTALLEAARWAPSSYGDQPWRFMVWDKMRDAAAWEKAFACLWEPNHAWAQHAPVFIFTMATPRFSHNGQPNAWALYDVGAAVENLCLQATALGLVAHQMGGFDAEKLRAQFPSIPADHLCGTITAMGHPGTADALPDALKAYEMAPRQRKPLTELVLAGF